MTSTTSPIPPPADAIVFVGGLSGGENMRPERVAEIMCWELDQRAGDRLARFSVRSVSVDDEVVHRIERTVASGTTPVADVYCVPHAEASAGAVPTAARRVFTLALQVFAGLCILIRAMAGRNRRAKSMPQKLQLSFCLLILLCLGAYFLTAVWALVQAIVTAVSGAGTTIAWPQWIVLTGAVLGVLWPNARERLSSAAESYLRMMRYVWTAGERNHLTGRIQGLVDKINRRPEIGNVHLVGYSFGALAVLDTVYPTSSAGIGRMQQVRTIVTVGCPFDLVRMLRPSYAADRGTATDGIPRWVNIYAPIDVLASNFSDGDRVTDQPQTGIEPLSGQVRKPDENIAWNRDLTLSVPNFLMLRSLQVHGEYWDGNNSARTALGDVMNMLYQGTPALN